MVVNWKSLQSGLTWVVFSPFMFFFGVMADRTSSDLEYEIQVLLSGAWSALGVISGIGTIAGAAWAQVRPERPSWIFIAVCSVLLMAVVFYSIRALAG